MGFADILIQMGIPYQSGDALSIGERIMRFIQDESHEASRTLGEEKGSFPSIDQSIYSGPMRNATVTTIAPTGSLHLIACTSSGIEPLFSCSGERVIDKKTFRIMHPALERLLKDVPHGSDLLEKARKTGSVQGLAVSREIQELFRNAGEMDPKYHVRMQAAFQKYVDNAVSKTVNLPEDATVEEISRIFFLARELGCKGITVYRYRSRKDQVLSRGCDTCRVDTLVP
jgi:ribonucleoside-diphosphate reductase alpha chain